jgi:hypothetical protein
LSEKEEIDFSDPLTIQHQRFPKLKSSNWSLVYTVFRNEETEKRVLTGVLKDNVGLTDKERRASNESSLM